MPQQDSKGSLSRRDFIKSSGTVLASAFTGGLASIGVAEDQVYQYIVVGSGAGGGPVAVNLARAGKRVLLLEAGDSSENQNYRIPAFWGASTEDPAYSWNFFGRQNSQYDSKNSNHTQGKGVLYPRAATVGGCTAHNAMITMYPHQSDWEHLAKLTGDRSWNPTSMRRYYQKVEDARYLSYSAARAKRRGKRGWLKLERTAPDLIAKDPVLAEFVLAAAEEFGLGSAAMGKLARLDSAVLRKLLDRDPNDWKYVAEELEGIVTTPRATFNGRRSGTRELILEAKASLRNFTLTTNALVTRVLFKPGSASEVVGVEYLEGRSLYEADPRSIRVDRLLAARHQTRKVARLAPGGEVILSGGAFNTPQLLMLSGIGPKAELERHRIPVRVRLEGVGKNLQDRYEVGVITRLKRPLDILKGCTFGGAEDACLTEYQKDPARSFYGTNGLVLGIKKRSRADKRDPDLYLFALPGYFKGYHPGWAANALKPDHLTWVVLKGHTRNTAGTVTLRSADPTATPEINFRYFSEGNDTSGDDLNAVVEGVRLARRINARGNFARHVSEEVYPSKHVQGDSDMREFVQKEAFGHHASCTSKMGNSNDPLSVVDGNFRVHGVRNLRVVDASVFARIPGLFIVAPTYMIAEKASEAILRSAKS